MIKDKIKQFMMNNKERCVVVNQIVDYINNYSLISSNTIILFSM